MDLFAKSLQSLRSGDLQDAAGLCDQLLAARPKDAKALHLRGLIAMTGGEPSAAVSFFERSLSLDSKDAQAHNNLGRAYHVTSDLTSAREHLEQACALNPRYVGALNNLGVVYRELELREDAERVLLQAVALEPGDINAHSNLGCLAADSGEPERALEHFERALRIDPARSEVHRNMALACKTLRRWQEAIEHFQQSGGLRADDPQLCFEMGLVLIRLHRFTDAEACLVRALEQHPNPNTVHNAIGALRNQQGRIEEALDCLKEAIRLDPEDAEAQSNLLLNMHYMLSVAPGALRDAHLACPTLSSTEPGNHHAHDPNPERRIRLGYVSPDFRRHPVGYFVRDLWPNHDREQFEVFAYAHPPFEDDFTQSLKPVVEHWVDCAAMTTEEMSERIRGDQIDILFDLAGHTAGNRLSLFAAKPAPVQISGMGYVNTTGLETMDYLLCDRFHLPEEDEHLYSERPLRMAHDYICYSPPAYAPEVAPLPAAENGSITFGNFNNLAKLGDEVALLWSRILSELPSARLLMKAHALGDAATHDRILQLFTRHGIDPQRILLERGARHADLLASYNRVDLALDPFPYSGGLTTVEALWMGVPVVTLRGDRFAGRHSTSHLSNAGLPQFVAQTADEYVALAVQWATDLPALATMRSQLRATMAASAICDGKAYTAELESKLRTAWSQWCSARPA